MLLCVRMPSSYWLLSTEAYQERLLRQIRLARTPITARSRGGRAERALPVAYDKSGVATIRVAGVLTPTPDAESEMMGEPNTTYPELQAALREATADKKTKEIVWSIDSPGGAVDGLFELLDDIAEARASGVKMRVEADNAHSAAYGIAAVAGNITATRRTTSVGSVGVATSLFLSGGMCGEVVDVTSSNAPEKRPNPKTPEGREVVTRYLDQIESEFMTSIAAGRGVTRDHVALKYGRGSSMLAGPAKEAGLIDAVASKRASANARTLTGAHSSDNVPERMADAHPSSESPAVADAPVGVEASAPVAAPAPPVAELAIPITLDLSDEDRAELAALRAERTARTNADRRGLITELVALGAETPATAWQNGAPVARLAAEPLADLQSRVGALRAARAANPTASAAVTPPASTVYDGLTPVERAAAEKLTGAHRERFIATRKARHESAAKVLPA